MFKTKIQSLLSYLSFDAWQRWEYKHTTILALSLIGFIVLLDTLIFTAVIDLIVKTGYFGALIGGILFVSVFTAVPAVFILLNLASAGLNIVLVAVIAALGAMLGDYLLLRFMEDKLAYELKPIALRLKIPQLVNFLNQHRPTNWLLRLIGAIIIASPLPDEIGVGLLGLSKTKRLLFLGTCFTLNMGGILAVLSLDKIL